MIDLNGRNEENEMKKIQVLRDYIKCFDNKKHIVYLMILHLLNRYLHYKNLFLD